MYDDDDDHDDDGDAALHIVVCGCVQYCDVCVCVFAYATMFVCQANSLCTLTYPILPANYAAIDFYLSLSSWSKGKWKHDEKHMKYKQ